MSGPVTVRTPDEAVDLFDAEDDVVLIGEMAVILLALSVPVMVIVKACADRKGYKHEARLTLQRHATMVRVTQRAIITIGSRLSED